MQDLIERRLLKEFGVDELQEIVEALETPTTKPQSEFPPAFASDLLGSLEHGPERTEELWRGCLQKGNVS